MRNVRRHVVVDHLGRRHVADVGFGVLVFQDLADVRHIQRTVAKCDAGGHGHVLEDRLDLFLAAVVGDRVDAASAERTHEQRALVAPGHLPRARHAAGVDADLEALGQLDRFQVGFELGQRCRQRRSGRWRQAFLGFGLVTQKPVRRWFAPELLGRRIILFQRLRLRRRAHQQRSAQRRDDGTTQHRAGWRGFQKIHVDFPGLDTYCAFNHAETAPYLGYSLGDEAGSRRIRKFHTNGLRRSLCGHPPQQAQTGRSPRSVILCITRR